MTPIHRDVLEFMVWSKGEIANLKKWQDNQDDHSKWISRLVISCIITAFIGNAATFIFSVLGWLVMLILYSNKLPAVTAFLFR